VLREGDVEQTEAVQYPCAVQQLAGNDLHNHHHPNIIEGQHELFESYKNVGRSVIKVTITDVYLIHHIILHQLRQ
jgi:hypothetical protein